MQEMGARRALFIPEITLEIFRRAANLDGIFVRPDVSGRKNLVSLAVSCQILSCIALDILWSDMYSILPILKTIPSLVVSNGVYVSFGFSRIVYSIKMAVL